MVARCSSGRWAPVGTTALFRYRLAGTSAWTNVAPVIVGAYQQIPIGTSLAGGQYEVERPIPGVTIRARSLHERADFLAHQDPLPLSGAAPQAVQAQRIFGPSQELLDPPERQQIETDVNTKLSALINQHDLTAHEIVGACIGMIGYAPAEPLLKLFWLTAMAEGVTQFRDKTTVQDLGSLILQSMKAMDLPNSELRMARYLLSQQVYAIVSTNISGAGPR